MKNPSVSKRIALSVLAMASFLACTANQMCADDWSHWRGNDRDGIISESSRWEARKSIPDKPIWETNVGIGSSSPLLVDGQLYDIGWSNNRDTLVCLDAEAGRKIWEQSYPAPKYGRHANGDQGLYAAITATPEYDSKAGFLYTLGIDGQLICWDTRREGRQVWNLNLHEQFHPPQRPKIGRSGRRDYGYTTSPLIHGDWLIVEVGAERGTLIAFDKKTGNVVWASEAKEPAGHSGGPVPMQVEGVPCVAVFALHALLVVRVDQGHEGETVARYPWETEYAQNVATPAVEDNLVLITAGYNHKSSCLLEITLQGAKKRWEQPYYSQICSPVIHDGRVYWVYQEPICLDLQTGSLLWKGPRRFGDAGSCLITTDDRLLILAGRGDLVLAETAERSPSGFRELARVGSLFRTDAWPHVVMADGLVYCKDRDGNLKCFDWRHNERVSEFRARCYAGQHVHHFCSASWGS